MEILERKNGRVVLEMSELEFEKCMDALKEMNNWDILPSRYDPYVHGIRIPAVYGDPVCTTK